MVQKISTLPVSCKPFFISPPLSNSQLNLHTYSPPESIHLFYLAWRYNAVLCSAKSKIFTKIAIHDRSTKQTVTKKCCSHDDQSTCISPKCGVKATFIRCLHQNPFNYTLRHSGKGLTSGLNQCICCYISILSLIYIRKRWSIYRTVYYLLIILRVKYNHTLIYLYIMITIFLIS